MKVLQINSVCNVGSTGRIVTDIADLLRKNGYESYVAYGCGKSNEPNSYLMENKLYLKFNILKTRLFGRHGFYNKRTTKKLIKWIDEVNPDIIHLHNLHGHYLNVEILFKYLKKLNKPVIWTLHDCWSFTGHCSYFDYIKCNRWIAGCYSCPQKHEYPNSWFFDRSKKNWEEKKRLFTSLNDLTIVTPSYWLANLVKESFLKKYEVDVIPNGIDLTKFKPIKSDFRNKYHIKGKIVLAVAFYWDIRKGFNYLPEIAKKLGENYTIIVVGVNKNQKRNLPKNIIAISKTNDIQQLIELYSIADVFINPTLEDNFPTVNLEALACGTPVITFKTGGSIEAIDENCGCIVNQGDIKTLISKIKEICEKPKFEKINKCVNKAKSYDKNRQLYKYIELYKIKGNLE